MEDIVVRLRNLGKRREMEGIYTDQNICEAAIETIESLRRQVVSNEMQKTAALAEELFKAEAAIK